MVRKFPGRGVRKSGNCWNFRRVNPSTEISGNSRMKISWKIVLVNLAMPLEVFVLIFGNYVNKSATYRFPPWCSQLDNSVPFAPRNIPEIQTESFGRIKTPLI